MMKGMKCLVVVFSWWILLFAMSACSDETDNSEFIKPTNPTTYLLSYQKVGTMSLQEIKKLFTYELPDFEIPQMLNDIDYYKIRYKSVYAGQEEIELSGLVLMPKNHDNKLHQMQYHHGTMNPEFSNHDGGAYTDAPSLFNHHNNFIQYDSYETIMFGLSIASCGYFISMPDFCGYGETQDPYNHLYDCAATLAQESYDMIMASRELAQELSVDLTNDISLSGWSEGGGISLYTQKLVEQNSKLKVNFNTCLAGMYCICQEAFDFLDKDKDDELSCWTGWAIMSACKQQGVDLSLLFNPAITDAKSLFEFCKSSSTLKSIFNETTIANDFSYATKLCRYNDAAKGWVPQGTVHFYHGLKDSIVPYAITTYAINEFKAAHTPDNHIKLHVYPDGDHESFDRDFLTQTIDYLEDYK